MAEPTLADLMLRVQQAGSAYGKAHHLEDRSTQVSGITVARAAHHLAKVLDDSAVPIVEADAEYLCSVLNSRVGVEL